MARTLKNAERSEPNSEFSLAQCKHATTIYAIVKAYGGNNTFAKHFNWLPSRTSNWSASNHIPLNEALLVYADMKHRGVAVPPAVLVPSSVLSIMTGARAS